VNKKLVTILICLGLSFTVSVKAEDYNSEINRLNQLVVGLQRTAFDKPNSWIHQERLAKVLLERARLSGKVQHYMEAQSVINHAFELAEGKGGPVLTRAAINFSMHRLPDIEADLVAAESAILVDKQTALRIVGLRADVLFNTGDYLKAKALYDQIEDAERSSISAVKLAFYYGSTADYSAAESWFEKAEERAPRKAFQLQSWLKLQQGILDLGRGRWHDALEHYEQALVLFPGHWLVEEHIAEIELLLGNTESAESKYRDLIQRTDSPIFMEALAGILQSNDNVKDQDEADILLARANDEFQTTMEFAPELISGHALEFFLQAGNNALALSLAQDNYRLRPAGGAAIALAQALALQGQLPKAITLIEGVLDTPFRNAELHATAHVLYRALGQTDEATQQKELAIGLSPAAIDEVDWLHIKLEQG